MAKVRAEDTARVAPSAAASSVLKGPQAKAAAAAEARAAEAMAVEAAVAASLAPPSLDNRLGDLERPSLDVALGAAPLIKPPSNVAPGETGQTGAPGDTPPQLRQGDPQLAQPSLPPRQPSEEEGVTVTNEDGDASGALVAPKLKEEVSGHELLMRRRKSFAYSSGSEDEDKEESLDAAGKQAKSAPLLRRINLPSTQNVSAIEGMLQKRATAENSPASTARSNGETLGRGGALSLGGTLSFPSEGFKEGLKRLQKEHGDNQGSTSSAPSSCKAQQARAAPPDGGPKPRGAPSLMVGALQNSDDFDVMHSPASTPGRVDPAIDARPSAPPFDDVDVQQGDIIISGSDIGRPAPTPGKRNSKWRS